MAETQKTKLKTVFKAKDGEQEVEYAVRRPTPKEIAEGQKVYNRAYREAVDSEALLRVKLEAVMRKQNLWDDEKEAQQERLNADIRESEKLLARGYRLDRTSDGQTVKLVIKMSEARDLAIKLRNLRWQLRDLLSVRSQMDGVTAEAQADNARFNYYVAKCLVYNQGDKAGSVVYKDVDDYMEHAGEPRAFEAAGHLMALLVGGSDPDWEKKLPENKFLLKYGFADNKLRLVNKEGKFIDNEGRLINEEGRYINEQGEFVNRSGERIDENGDFVFPPDEVMEFEDDLGVTQNKPAAEETSGEPVTESAA